MTEADNPKPALALIDCDRSELERRLLEVLCSMPLEEFEKAVASLTSRAKLRVVNPDDAEPNPADSP